MKVSNWIYAAMKFYKKISHLDLPSLQFAIFGWKNCLLSRIFFEFALTFAGISILIKLFKYLFHLSLGPSKILLYFQKSISLYLVIWFYLTYSFLKESQIDRKKNLDISNFDTSILTNYFFQLWHLKHFDENF